jgi:M6 family metalloprotease-like protein
MAAPIMLASGVLGAIGCRFVEPSDLLVFTEFGGRLSAAKLDGSSYTILGSGYVEPEDVVAFADGEAALVTERGGTLLRVRLDDADRSSAAEITTGLFAPHQIALLEADGVAWVIEYSVGGRVVEIDLSSGAQTVIATGFENSVGLAVRKDRTLALIAEQAAAGGRITAYEPSSGTRTPVADGLTAPFFLSWLDDSEESVLVAERDPANRIALIDLTSSPPTHRLVAVGTAFRPSQALVIGDQLVVTADTEVDAYDITAGFPAEVKLELADEPLYVGSYTSVKVDTAGSGVMFDDLEFAIPSGRRGGQVSLSRDFEFEPSNPEVLLLAGYAPETHRLQAIHEPTGAVVGERKFELTDMWADDEHGPKKWFNGFLASYGFGPTWGGGAAGAPQNYNTIPASGTKRVAILLVDTADQRYTTDATTLASFRTRWQQNAFDGLVGSDGVSRSMAQFYREVSYKTLGQPGIDITGTVFTDVVHLSGHWGDYFAMDANGAWAPKGEFINQCVTAAGDGVDLTGYDMIVCVSQAVPASGGSPAKVAWPYGGIGVGVDSAHGHVGGRGISMPNEWGDGSSLDQGGGRTIYETLTHEMGHTLNLPDEYKPDVPGRMLAGTPAGASWDPMEQEGPLPHLTVAHRMMLGWVQPSWVKLYNFLASGATVDETITLAAVESAPPPTGQFAGMEVRVGDGRNYYFEYRRGQSGEIGDRQLVPDSRIVGTDVSEPPDPPVIDRPDILLLAKHGDDSGAVLDSGQFYHEVDNTTPTFPSDFRLDVVSHNGNAAQVRVRYGVLGKPDPSIRPWPRDSAHQWQSPDIEVQNARNAADPAWANVPWQGHANTVVANIKNRGALSAPGVSASFFVKDYTVGGAPETFLGSDTHDIGPAATVAFTVPWNIPAPADPSAQQHFCIIVRIDHYETPTTPPVQEMTDANNTAQSNYDRFISATSIPSREIAYVTVGNPYSERTRFFISAGQSNPLYRTYLEHDWLLLDPGETRRLRVMFEFAPDAEQSDPKVKKQKKKYLRVPNFVNIAGAIEDPLDPRLHGPSWATGVTAQIASGRSTKFRDVRRVRSVVTGRVTTADDKPVPGGKVVVTAWDHNRKREHSLHTDVQPGTGTFQAKLPGKWAIVDAYYTGAPGYADCESEVVSAKKDA